MQAFALGFFFMISGYFTPVSFDRKGGWGFLRDRFIRLGIPLAANLCDLDGDRLFDIALDPRAEWERKEKKSRKKDNNKGVPYDTPLLLSDSLTLFFSIASR